MRNTVELRANGGYAQAHGVVEQGGRGCGDDQHGDGAGEKPGYTLGPQVNAGQTGGGHDKRGPMQFLNVRRQRGNGAEQAGLHGHFKSEKVFDLRQEDQHRDAGGKSADEGVGDIADQRAHAGEPHEEKDDAGHDGADEQVGHAVLGDYAQDDDDERPGGAADGHARATEKRGEESCDDCGDEPGFGLDPGSDGKGHGQGQGDDAHSKPGHNVGLEDFKVVVAQAVPEFGVKGKGEFHSVKPPVPST